MTRPTHSMRRGALAVGLALAALSVTATASAQADEGDALPPAPSDQAVTTTTAVTTTPSTTTTSVAPPEVDATEPTQPATPEPTKTLAAPLVRAQSGSPHVSVTPTTGLLPNGGTTITVTGSGFDPVKNNKVGVYVVFGPKDPGTYFQDANRFLAAAWVHPGGGAGGSGQAEMNADGSFSVTLPRPGALPLTSTYTDGNGKVVDCNVTPCQVITMAAHGVPDRSQDTFTPVSFAASGGGGSTTTTVTSNGTGTGIGTGTTATGSMAGSASTGGTGSTGTSGSSTSGGSTLAQTGVDLFPYVLVAALLLLAGTAMLNSQATRQLRARRSPTASG